VKEYELAIIIFTENYLPKGGRGVAIYNYKKKKLAVT
jgi:hypothetical protein